MATPLSELVSRLALLAAPHPYSVTARLVQEPAGIELKAVREDSDPNREFVRVVTFGMLVHLGAALVAREFARDARAALSSRAALPVRARKR